jgi:hypothetical protein
MESTVSNNESTENEGFWSKLDCDFKIENPIKMYIPKVKTSQNTLDLEKFNALQTIAHAKEYQIGENTDNKHSVLYENLRESFSVGKDQSLQKQIVRKYLLSVQHEFFKLTENPNLIKIASLHGDLLDLSEKLNREWEQCAEMDFCSMLLGETFDLFSSTVSQICVNEYWNQGKPAEDVINSFISKELMKLRVYDAENMKILSKTLLRRCIEKAPNADKHILLEYAENEGISVNRR